MFDWVLNTPLKVTFLSLLNLREKSVAETSTVWNVSSLDIPANI